MVRWRRVSPTTSLELVVFDCDGVLVDSERLINRIEPVPRFWEAS